MKAYYLSCTNGKTNELPAQPDMTTFEWTVPHESKRLNFKMNYLIPRLSILFLNFSDMNRNTKIYSIYLLFFVSLLIAYGSLATGDTRVNLKNQHKFHQEC